MFRLFRTPASVRKMSLFSCISSERPHVHLVNVQVVQNSCQREEDVPCSVVSPVSGPMYIQSMFRLFRTPASVGRMSLFSCISSEGSDVYSVNVQVVQNSCQCEEDVPVQMYLQ